MNKRLFVFSAAVLAGAMLVAGCGSSDDNDSTASLSKAEFVKQGNAICRKGNAKIESEFEEFAKERNIQGNKKPSNGVIEEVSETILIPSVTKQVEEIRALGTPEGDEGEVDEILGAAEEGIEEGEEDPVAFVEGQPASFKEANKKAREYGLTVCGEENE